jgi:hypothetical protein
MAIWRRGKPDAQYTSEQFRRIDERSRRRLLDHGGGDQPNAELHAKRGYDKARPG